MELISASNGMSPAWSPDGRWIAFLSNRAEGWDLYAAPAAGGDARRLTRGATADDPAWTTDGQGIAVHRRGGIDLARLDGGRPERLDESATQAAFSPSGRLALIRSGRLWLRDEDTEADMGADTGVDGRDPSWASDGRRIALARAGGIEIVDTDTGMACAVADAQRGTAPAWCPTADRIAFERDGAVHVAELGSGTVDTLRTPRPCGRPSWSPDGNAIAFQAHTEANWNVLVLDLESGDLRNLTAATWVSWNVRS